MNRKRKEKLIRIINEVMSIDITKIDHKKKLSEISEWESLDQLLLISRLEDEYNIKFTELEVKNPMTLDGFFELMAKKLK